MAPKCSRQVFGNSVRGTFCLFSFVLRPALAKSFSCCRRGFGVFGSTVEFRCTFLGYLFAGFAFVPLALLSFLSFHAAFCSLSLHGLSVAFFVASVRRFRSSARFYVSCGAGAALFHAFGESKSLHMFRLARAQLVSSCFAVQRLAALAKGFISSNSRKRNAPTATQQGAAPDRLQPALWSFLPSLRLPAAGELGRCVARARLDSRATFY